MTPIEALTLKANPRLLLVAALAFLPGCLTINMTRVASERAPEIETVATLVEGESDLTQCLAALGAPLEVQELEEGAVLGWGWRKARFFGVNVSFPLSRDFSGSVRYNRTGDDVQGLVLFFDDAWTLRRIRRGYLRDLLRSARSRPNLVEE